MNPSDLPRELADLERQLAERAVPKPTEAFRRRVLTAMRTDRARPDGWRFAAALVAAVLLCLNLALSLANHRAWSPVEGDKDGDVETGVRELRQENPDLSEEEAYQVVVLRRTAPSLAAVAALPSSPDEIFSWERSASWDTP